MLNSDASSEEEDQIYGIQEETSNASEPDYCDGLGPCICQIKSVNMISSYKGLMIKAIDNIQDLELQREYLSKLKDIITQEEKKKHLEEKTITVSTR